MRLFPVRFFVGSAWGRPTQLLLLLSAALPALGWTDGTLPTIAKKTDGLAARPGLLVNFVDVAGGKAYLQLPKPDEAGLVGKYLYVESLTTGLGSNDLGLDRTQFGGTYVVDVREFGDRVLIEAENTLYRSDTKSEDERKATREGFATSVLWAGHVVARDDDGSALLDITDFVVRDAHNSASRLSGYSFDGDRSVVDPVACKSFPDNIDFEALLTFKSSTGSPRVGDHAPDARIVSIHQHHSLVRLPDDGYRPRRFDPRAGMFEVAFTDFAAPLSESLTRRYVTRFRLEKVHPEAARSPVKKQIVYYVDRGVPEPVRSALIEGGNYWARAFDAAGFENAFRVEAMPPGVDPMDIRYNVVQWMNRSTRGYAYGQAVVDPRTGEILKGAVNLDSRRVRQDILIFEGLLGAENTGSGKPDDPIAIALGRMRQLAAHEIGHTIGFAHNFAASTYGDRASVMDYPAPLFRIGKDGNIDLSDAYAKGVGAWDIQAVRYGYTEFPAGQDEKSGLDEIVQDGIHHGLKFLSDEDADEADGADSDANRWDNMSDPIADLRNTLAVRQKALGRFGERNLHKDAPVADLELVLGPLYFLHRYDVDAVSKLVGGFHYVQAIKGDGQTFQTRVPAEIQMKAIDSLLWCLRPELLAIPSGLASKMGPVPYGYDASPEAFPRWTSYSFDTMAAAASAGDMVLADLLNPARCARLVEFHAREAAQPSLEGVIDRVQAALVRLPAGSAQQTEIGWTLQHVFLSRLLQLADAETAAPGVLARADAALRRFVTLEEGLATADATGHAKYLAAEAERFLNRQQPARHSLPPPLRALPGAPIGG